MKNFKKLTAFVLAVAVMLSSMTFANAAVSQEAKKLNQMGLLLNITEGELNQELMRVFGITMVLKALGYKDEDTLSKVKDNPFTDMNEFSWAKGFAAIAYENKITDGVSLNPKEKRFAPKEQLTKKQFLTFMLRVLGYEPASAWANTEKLAKEAGILVDGSEIDKNFTKDDAARIMFAAMGAKLVGAEGRLVDRLISKGKVTKANATAVGLLAPEMPKELAVESVVANNLREVEVKFTRELNEESAKKLSSYRITGSKGVSSRSISAVSVKEDKRTVVLTVGPSVLQNKQEYKLTVKDVRDLNGQVISKVEIPFSSNDVSTPNVTGIEFVGPRNVKITFNEPIQNVGNVEIKEGTRKVSAKAPQKDAAKENVVYVETHSMFKNTEYTFFVEGFRDYAGYPNIIHEETRSFEKVTSAPSVEVVAADQGKVELQFDRPVRGITAKHFYHSFSSYTAKKVYKDAALKSEVSANEYVSKVWVVFATGVDGNNRPLPPRTEFFILDKVDGNQIQDNWGNKFERYNTVLNVEADKNPPVVESVDVQSETKIVVTFNKELSEAGTYKILNSNGKTLTTPSVKLNGRTVTLTFSRLTNVTNAILEIKGAKDNTLSRNQMTQETHNIEFTDKVFEGVESADYRAIRENGNIVGGEIYVVYKEGVNSSATEADNYRISINGQAESMRDQEFNFGDNNKTIVIRLNEAMAKKVEANLEHTDLVIGAVKDLANNAPANFQIVVKLKGVTQATLQKAVMVQDGSTTKVQLHYNRGIASILNTNGFVIHTRPEAVYSDANAVNVNELTVTDANIKADDSRVVEVSLSHQVYATTNFVLRVEANTLEDTHGTKLNEVSTNSIEDKVSPKVLTVNDKKEATAYKDSGNYYVKLSYTEAINVNSLASGTYRVDGADGKFTISERPTVSGKDVIIKVNAPAGVDFNAELSLVQIQDIQDVAGNTFKDSSSIEVKKADTWNN